jgi:hypothetical protein
LRRTVVPYFQHAAFFTAPFKPFLVTEGEKALSEIILFALVAATCKISAYLNHSYD